MADRYEPKVPVRPLSDRRPQPAVPADDPLAELARIVSGRAPFEPPAAEKAKPAAPEAPVPGNLGRDLESELLSDLQASFAAVRDSIASPAAVEPPAPPPVPPAARAASPPRAVSLNGATPPPVAAAEAVTPRPTQPQPSAFPGPDLESLEKLLNEMVRPAPAERPMAPAPVSTPAAAPRTAPPPRPQQRLAAAPAPSQPPGAPVPSPAPAAAKPAVTSPFRPARSVPAPARSEGGHARPDVASAPLRPSVAATAPSAPNPPRPAAAPAGTVRAPSRWDRPADTGPETSSRFAPPRTGRVRPPQPREPEPEPVEELLVDEAATFVEEPLPFEAEAEAQFEEFAPDDIEAPPFGPDDDLPPFPEDELAELSRRRSRRAVMAVVGVILVAAVGGAAFFYLQPTIAGNSVPPIIAADASPTKVVPDSTAPAGGDPQAKLIYDRVDESTTGDNTTLVTPGDQPIADVAAADTNRNNPITRVIIPGGPGIDGPLAGDAETTDDSATIGPRKVRTVVVRPDGTIVSSEAAPADGAAAGPPPAAVTPDPPPAAPTRTDMDAVLDGGTVAVNPDPLGTASTGRAPPPPAGTVPAAPAVEDLPLTASPPPAAPPRAPAPAPKAPPARAPTTVATNAPIDITPSRPATRAPTAPAAAGGGMLVQVSSQRSQEAAMSTFRDLQSRYPNILGSYQPNIQRADLGDRGIYFRVRVGPFAPADAQRVCETLKSAGGDCLLAR